MSSPATLVDESSTAYPDGTLIHRVFSAQAARYPQTVAVVDGARRVTYRELDQISDHFAALLRGYGAGPGRVVPVLLGRSVDLVASLLAVLKTGAAYTALDPNWPAARLDQVFAILDAPVVIGTPAPAGIPHWQPTARLWAEARSAPARFEPPEVAGTDAAAVFWTSGSTGTPKGVVSPHRATVRLFPPRPGIYHFRPGGGIPQAAPLPWDGLTLELWSALLTGGTSVLCPDAFLNPATLRAMIRDEGVYSVWLTSSLFNLIVDEDVSAFTGLSQVLTGGERLSVPHVRRFLDTHPDIHLINGYGPAETCVFATCHRITTADCDDPAGIPVGRPVPRTRVHVLDGTRECAAGEPGEICISGDGLASGYLGDPELTGARFVTVPVHGRPTRVYRSGDRGTLRPDGVLEFGGRMDRQVKVRGYRIEPDEIEATLRRVPELTWCRVVALPPPTGTELLGLALFYTGGPTEDELAQRITALLPAHLRPAALLRIDTPPLTGNGKVDERALLGQLPQRLWPARREPVGPPTTPGRVVDVTGDPTAAEAAVAAAVESLTGQPLADRRAPFSTLGLSSLDLCRVALRVGTATGQSVPVSQLATSPDCVSLAHWLSQPPVRPTDGAGFDADTGVPLTPEQRAFWLGTEFDPDDLAALCPIAWWIEGEVRPEALDAAVAAVHRRHDALHSRYVLAGEPVAVAAQSPPPVLVRAEATSRREAVARAAAELFRPMDLEQGQLWRCVLVSVSPRLHLLGVTLHHIAFDGWSESLLAADLSAGYAEAVGRPGEPRPPVATLRDLAVARAARLARVDRAAQRDYWLRELADLPRLALPAPADPGAPRTVMDTHPVAARTLAGLRAQARDRHSSVYAMLLGTYGYVLAGLVGQDDFGVGVPIAQRGDAATEWAIGCLIDTLCLRPRPTASLEESLDRATRVVQAAMAARDVGIRDLPRDSGSGFDRRLPMVQTMLALQDNVNAVLELPGTRTSLLRMTPDGTLVDLLVELWPQRDGGAELTVTFAAEIVDAGFVTELARRFTGVLAERFGRDPDDAGA